jgi:hypothetical protein
MKIAVDSTITMVVSSEETKRSNLMNAELGNNVFHSDRFCIKQTKMDDLEHRNCE